MLLIFWLSSFPAPERIKDLPIIYEIKPVHIVEYGLMSFLFWFALAKTTSLKPGEVAFLAIMLTILYGAIDELHQAFVPFRTGSNIDIIADGAGAGIVQGAILFFSRKRSGLHSK